MKKILSLCTLFVLTSCTHQKAEEKIAFLNGYWNIDLVEKPDGTVKEFPFTNHMDFFETNGIKGTKSRVSPTYDGGFIVYGDPVVFTWESTDDQVFLKFEDGDGAYTQNLRKATETELELVHDDGTIYYYKSYQSDEE